MNMTQDKKKDNSKLLILLLLLITIAAVRSMQSSFFNFIFISIFLGILTYFP